VQKVLELLGKMKEKGQEEKQKEALQFAAFEQFCKGTSEEKTKVIEASTGQLEILKADLGKLATDIADLEAALPDLTADIEKWEGEKKKATEARQKQHSAYTEAHAESLKAIKSVGKAYKSLKDQNYDREAKSFLQLSGLDDPSSSELDAFTSSSQARAAIEAFLAESAEVKPKAAGYEFQSGKILELLQNLQTKFKTERETIEKTEVDQRHSYEMLLQDWKSQISGAQKTREDKLAAKQRKDQVKAEKEAALLETTKLNEDDKKYLKDLQDTCMQKASDFKERQRLRGEELAAIDKATEAIQGTVLKAARPSKGTSLAALRSDTFGVKRERAISMLRERAEELESNMLSSLALRVEGNGLTKIRGMISDLITRLQEEAAADTEKEGWCKKELASNEQTRTKKQQQMETLQTEFDQLQVDITELGDSIDALSKDVTKLNADRSTATKLRDDEKAENLATVKDAQDAQKAIAQAVAALDSFYSSTKAKASLVQVQSVDAPDIFEDASYTGMESGGVTALLEVLQADFSRMETDTEAAEAQSLGEYTKFMSDSAVDKAAKEKEVELKTASKSEKANALASKKIDLKDAEKALSAAAEYYEELKPQCLAPAMTKEEKMEKRKQEIQSLKDVLDALQGTVS